MSTEDRLKFSRGEGMRIQPSDQQVQQQIQDHREEEQEMGVSGGTAHTQTEFTTPLGETLRGLQGTTREGSPPQTPSE